MKTQNKSTKKTGEKPVDLLKEDHKKVKQLFKDFEDTESTSKKEKIVNEVISELKVHTKLEEELFYPAARQEVQDSEEGEDLMNEAEEEHHVVDLIIAELEELDPEDEHYDAKFTVMAENVKHHIEEEEGDLFLRVKNTAANAPELGAEMKQRKQQLMQEIAKQERAAA